MKQQLLIKTIADLIIANGKEGFVHFANWWCDIDIPLGDLVADPLPPTLRKVLSFITKGESPSKSKDRNKY